MEGSQAPLPSLFVLGVLKAWVLTRWHHFCEMGGDGMTGEDGLLTPGKIKIPTRWLSHQENVSVPKFFPSLYFSFDVARCFRCC